MRQWEESVRTTRLERRRSLEGHSTETVNQPEGHRRTNARPERQLVEGAGLQETTWPATWHTDMSKKVNARLRDPWESSRNLAFALFDMSVDGVCSNFHRERWTFPTQTYIYRGLL